jgi:uncharacterized protein (DUF169 family)
MYGGLLGLGLRELTPSLKSGEFYYKLGKFESWPACKRTIDRVPHVESLTTMQHSMLRSKRRLLIRRLCLL